MTDWYARCTYDPRSSSASTLPHARGCAGWRQRWGFDPDRSISARTLAGSPYRARSRFTTMTSISRSASPRAAPTPASSSAPAKAGAITPAAATILPRSACSTMRRPWQRGSAQSSRRRTARFLQHRPRDRRRLGNAETSVRHARRCAMISAIGAMQSAPGAYTYRRLIPEPSDKQTAANEGIQ
jgi:hypothetical protein